MNKAPERIWAWGWWRGSTYFPRFYAFNRSENEFDRTDYVRGDIHKTEITAMTAERDKLREVSKAVLFQYKRDNPMRTADWHEHDCECLRCCMDWLSAALNKVESDQ